MPMIGLGVWQLAPGSECTAAVRWALEAGYRHIDTARDYGNEESVGRALRDCGLRREELFLTTKFFPGSKDPVEEAENSLRRLGVDYVDLYLVHWPQGGPTWAWPGMERVRELGYARSIGVSNFNVNDLDELVAAAKTPPSVNQIWFNPFNYRRALVTGSRRRGVAIEGFSPLGSGQYISDATVAEIADRLGRTPAQVLLRWCVQHGIATIPKSARRDRIEANIQIFDFALSEADMAELDKLDETGGTDRAFEVVWW
jgi:2,5-diketo-D-gluconate reductase A